MVNVLERLLPAINPEKPLQNVIWSFTTQGARGLFLIGTRESESPSCEKKILSRRPGSGCSKAG